MSDTGFADFAAAQTPSMLGLAHALTGNPRRLPWRPRSGRSAVEKEPVVGVELEQGTADGDSQMTAPSATENTTMSPRRPRRS
jgi:hypothetical protein